MVFEKETTCSNKAGNVMKCPNCGAPYQPGTGKCPECGHMFQNLVGNSYAQRLADGVQQILNEESSALDLLSIGKRKKLERYIGDFPIPNTKDDMLEFIISMDSKRKMVDSNNLQGAYNTKYKEVVKKAKIVFPDDKQIETAIKMTNKPSLSNLSLPQRILLGSLVVLIILILFIVLLSPSK